MAFIFAGENLCPSSSSYLLRSSRKRVPPHRYQNTLFGCTTLEIHDKTNGGSAGGGCSIKSAGGGSGANAPVETSGGNEGHSIDIDPTKLKKLKRQVQNKISAAKARKKIIQYKEETEKKIKDLQEEKSILTAQVSILTNQSSVLSDQASRLTDEAARWKKLALEANLIYHTDGLPMADTQTCQLCDCFGHTAKNCLHHLVFPCEKEYNVVPNIQTTTTTGSYTDPNEDDNSTSSATSTSNTVKHQSLSWEEDELATLLQQPTIGEDFISRCSLFELSADSFNC